MRLALLSCLAASLVLLASCSSFELEESFTLTQELGLDGPVALDVVCEVGSIEVGEDPALEGIEVRGLVKLTGRDEERARARFIVSAEARWAPPMPVRGRASARAFELVRRARVPCGVWHTRMVREMGGVRKWPKVACIVAARTESTHSRES